MGHCRKSKCIFWINEWICVTLFLMSSITLRAGLPGLCPEHQRLKVSLFLLLLKSSGSYSSCPFRALSPITTHPPLGSWASGLLPGPTPIPFLDSPPKAVLWSQGAPKPRGGQGAPAPKSAYGQSRETWFTLPPHSCPSLINIRTGWILSIIFSAHK